METHEELIQRSFDSTLSEKDQQRLEDVLANDPQAAALHSGLLRVHTELSNAPQLDPPPAIRITVMQRIKGGILPKATHSGALSSAIRHLSDLIRIRPAYGVGLGFALGVLALLPVALTMQHGGLDSALLSGTLASGAGEPGNSLGGPLVIQSEAAQGSCEATVNNQQMRVFLDLSSPNPLQIEIRHLGTEPGMAGAAVQSSTAAYVESGEHRVLITHAGDNAYRLSFVRAGDQTPGLVLSLWDGDRLVFQGGLGSGAGH